MSSPPSSFTPSSSSSSLRYMCLIATSYVPQFGIATLLTSRDDESTDKAITSSDPPVFLESHVAVVDESDRCVWSQGTEGFIDVDNDDSLEIVSLGRSSIDDIHSSITNNQNNSQRGTSSSTADLGNEVDVSVFPYLQLDVKRRMMISIFDSTIAGCEISILPLMLHPNVTTERWFALTDFTTGEVCGKILVRLLFVSPQTDTAVTVGQGLTAAGQEEKVRSLPAVSQSLPVAGRGDAKGLGPGASPCSLDEANAIMSSMSINDQQQHQQQQQQQQQHLNEHLSNPPAAGTSTSNLVTESSDPDNSNHHTITKSSGSTSTSTSSNTNTSAQQKLQEILNKRKELLSQTKAPGQGLSQAPGLTQEQGLTQGQELTQAPVLTQGQGLANATSVPSESTAAITAAAPSVSDWLRSSSSSSSSSAGTSVLPALVPPTTPTTATVAADSKTMTDAGAVDTAHTHTHTHNPSSTSPTNETHPSPVDTLLSSSQAQTNNDGEDNDDPLNNNAIMTSAGYSHAPGNDSSHNINHDINHSSNSTSGATTAVAAVHSAALDADLDPGATPNPIFNQASALSSEPDLSMTNEAPLVEMEDRDDVSEVFIDDDDDDDEESSDDDDAEAVQAELEQLSREINNMAHDIAATCPVESPAGDPPSASTNNTPLT